MFWPLADFAKDFRLRNWWLASEIHVTNNPTVVELQDLNTRKGMYIVKVVYYTVEVHNFDLQEKTTSTLK